MRMAVSIVRVTMSVVRMTMAAIVRMPMTTYKPTRAMLNRTT